jgi:hypothetical protein
MTCMYILRCRWLELSGIEATAERTGISYSIYDPVKKYTLVSTIPDDPEGQKTSDDPPVDVVQVRCPSRLSRTYLAHTVLVSDSQHPPIHALTTTGGGAGGRGRV